jgi:MraZ protein
MSDTRRLPRLLGQTAGKIDDKGRMVLPSQHRERFAEDAVLVVRGDHLGLYEGAAWDAFRDALEELVATKQAERRDVTIIANRAQEVRPDSAGRILIPAWMREVIGLERDVVISGNSGYLGINRPELVEHVPEETEHRVNGLLNSL